jgi:(1->4)-alpha-D-glucan 1-alpha-D-glucosylmutase
MNTPTVPGATYRLQFNAEFTFADARDVVAYLHMLGISHVYASSFLKARGQSARRRQRLVAGRTGKR